MFALCLLAARAARAGRVLRQRRRVLAADTHAAPPPPHAADGYAGECQTPEGGWGLDAIVRENNWKLRGIVNGIDYK